MAHVHITQPICPNTSQDVKVAFYWKWNSNQAAALKRLSGLLQVILMSSKVDSEPFLSFVRS